MQYDPKSPHVRHTFHQENGNQKITFYKILSSFTNTVLSYGSSVHDKSLKKRGKPLFLDTYLLDIFACEYISFSIPDDCPRPKHVCTCKAMDESVVLDCYI